MIEENTIAGVISTSISFQRDQLSWIWTWISTHWHVCNNPPLPSVGDTRCWQLFQTDLPWKDTLWLIDTITQKFKINNDQSISISLCILWKHKKWNYFTNTILLYWIIFLQYFILNILFNYNYRYSKIEFLYLCIFISYSQVILTLLKKNYLKITSIEKELSFPRNLIKSWQVWKSLFDHSSSD